ncbi:MAG: glycosyltransferase [Chloroflexi bacterium]|nr:glycosyltransferase [Chloroflexota bacterium]
MADSLSVLICTHNRPNLLRQCLAALIDESDEKPSQVVVVNGGDDRSDQVVQGFATRGNQTSIRVECVKTVNRNLAASRNVGLPHCTGDIVGMTDDDAQVFPDWVTQMKRIHAEHPEAGAVGGPVIGADADSLVSRIADQVTFAAYAAAGSVRTLAGVNVSYKKRVVEAVGPQDESLFRGEDVDYNWRVQRLGWTVYYDPRVRVRHHHRPTLRSFLNQHYMYGRAYYLVRRKWKEMYCIYPHSFRRPKDLLKALNFAAGLFYEPLQYGMRMECPADRLLALPILFVNGLGWRGGMVQQKLACARGQFEVG